MSELIDKIKEELCREGICFRPEDELEIIAESWDEYLDYVKGLIDSSYPCMREILERIAMYDDVIEKLAEAMLGDTVYRTEIDGTEYYVRLR